MAHARAKLTPIGRRLLVERVVIDGWKPADAARAMGVSRQTAYKWLRRFRDEGPAGLDDRSSAPKRCPHGLGRDREDQIVAHRLATLQGPQRKSFALAMPRSTIYGVLRRRGVSRLSFIDRPTRTVVRYERDAPGDLLHVDVKKLGRIRPGGGWKVHGREMGKTHEMRTNPVGFDYLHVAVDDHSRVAFIQAHADEKGPTCATFLADALDFFSELGVTTKRVMTDNALNYRRSSDFQAVLAARDIVHKRTRPYRPQTNGKVERLNRTILEEFAYAEVFTSNDERRRKLQPWVDSYNQDRPHTALGGQTPMERLRQQR
jgi:transposase InsO family protein